MPDSPIPTHRIVWLPEAQKWAVIHVAENVEMERFGSLWAAEQFVLEQGEGT